MNAKEVNGKDEDGWSPLLTACACNNSQALTQLLATPGIDVNGKDWHGYTPLHAACSHNNSQALTQLLATPGIEVNAKNNGYTAIMLSAVWCCKETLKIMLADLRVDIDVKGSGIFSGKGLEELVGYSKTPSCTAITKRECLEMIEQERRRRQNIAREEMQSCNETNTMKGFQNLEDVRAKVRIQYLEQIDKTNQQIQDKEQGIHGKLDIRKLKMNDLKRKHDLEKRTSDMKSDQEITKLKQKAAEQEQQLANTKQRMSEMEQRKRRECEEIKKKQGDEKSRMEEIFKKEDEEEQDCLASLKQITSQLAKDLSKLDLDPNNDTSQTDQETVKAARETLECPICMEDMKPPVRIWMCPTSHIVCESCKDQLEGRLCPTCRTERVTQRAFMAENFARSVFHE